MKGEGSHVNSDVMTSRPKSREREERKLWSGRKLKRREREERERAKQSDYVERHESRMMIGGRAQEVFKFNVSLISLKAHIIKQLLQGFLLW